MQKTPPCTIGDSLSFGWQLFNRHPWHFVFVGILFLIPSLATQGFFLFVALTLYPFFIYNYLLSFTAGRKPAIKSFFTNFHRLLPFVFNYLVVLLATLLGLALFILPGIYLYSRLAFAPFLVIERNLDPIAALKESWAMTSGHVFFLIKFQILSFIIMYAGLLVFLIGFFVTVPLVIVAEVYLFFRFLNRNIVTIEYRS